MQTALEEKKVLCKVLGKQINKTIFQQGVHYTAHSRDVNTSHCLKEPVQPTAF